MNIRCIFISLLLFAAAGSALYASEPESFCSITYTAPKARKSRNGAMNIPGDPAEEFYGMMYKPYGFVGALECSDDGVDYRTVWCSPWMLDRSRQLAVQPYDRRCSTELSP